jgi:16S rRNA processing protein RimM
VTVSGEPVGSITRIQHGPGADLLQVKRPDGRTTLVPFVAAIVPTVDLAKREVTIDPPGGLLEL